MPLPVNPSYSREIHDPDVPITGVIEEHLRHTARGAINRVRTFRDVRGLSHAVGRLVGRVPGSIATNDDALHGVRPTRSWPARFTAWVLLRGRQAGLMPK
jgi:hypothetical protein